jgi:uncharacterized membrane protein
METQAPGVAVSETEKKRWTALDLFRLLAVLLMVQGHAFNVVVEEAIRPVTWYRWHNYVHGYTAPMFLFAAGLAFGLTTFRRWPDHQRLGRPFWKRVERYAMIVAIGYLLHLPDFAARPVDAMSPDQVRNFLKVDALHNIGVTLLLAEVLVVALRRRGVFVATMATLGSAVVLFAPAIARLPAEEWLSAPLVGYVNDRQGSLFPLVPWSGFICAGIVVAHFVERYHARAAKWPDAGQLTAYGAALLVLSLVLGKLDLDVFGEHNFWKTSPLFFLWRVGIVMLVLAVLVGVERFVPRGRPLRLVEILGMETLVIYVAHLIVLYGSPVHPGFHRTIGKTLPIPEATVFFLVLLGAMVALAAGWHWIKTRHPDRFRILRLGLMVAVIMYVFVLA